VASSRNLMIGIGNAYGRDDAVGLIVARSIRETLPAAVDVLEHSGEGASLLETWKGRDAIVVVDAVRSGARPGSIHRLDASREPLPAETFRQSTHAFSLVEAIELARALNQLPERLIVYGIEGLDFTAGTGLSPEVEAAVPLAVKRVIKEFGEQSD
jgi:hydrogenase maturation protease